MAAMEIFLQRLTSAGLEQSQNSCHLDTQVVMLLALSEPNRRLFCRELIGFLQHCRERDGTVTLMQHTDAIRERFGVVVEQGAVGSLGWGLQFFSMNRVCFFKVHGLEELARVFVVDRPILVVDGVKTLKKFARCSQFIDTEVGGVPVRFRLRAIGGHSNGHWSTFVDVNDGASKCSGVHVDVRSQGVHFARKVGGAFTRDHRQKCYLYEYDGRLSDLPQETAARLRRAARTNMKQTLVEFLRNQTSPDATAHRKRLMQSALARAEARSRDSKSTNEIIEHLGEWTVKELIEVFHDVFDDDSKLRTFVRFFVQSHS
jgi:hypothetical protein